MSGSTNTLDPDFARLDESLESNPVSNADADAAARLEELEYNRALNANVSNFVTVKLSGFENYDIWHAQMMCLLEVYNVSWLFDHRYAWFCSKSVEIVERYDKLLKSWVISSIDKEVHKRVSHRSSAMDIYVSLKYLYAKKNERLTGPAEWLEYNKALKANVSNFVTVKLSGHENYEFWNAQMTCLVEVYNMTGLFNCDQAWYASKGDEIFKRYDNLLKGWVINSIDQQIHKRVSHCITATEVCHRLQELYGQRNKNLLYAPGQTDPILMDVSPNDNEESTKLTKLLNATMEGSWWKAKTLLKRHENADAANPDESSESNQVSIAVADAANPDESSESNQVSIAVADAANPDESSESNQVSNTDADSASPVESLELNQVSNTDADSASPVESLELNQVSNAGTLRITEHGDTMLHVAVKEGKNYFVKQLLNFIKAESEIKTMNKQGHTALHTAVLVDNKQAAELLVKKCDKLLDDETHAKIPLVFAYHRGQINTFLYLLGVTGSWQELLRSYCHPSYVHLLIANATSTKEYNLALEVLALKVRDTATNTDNPVILNWATENDEALMALTTNFPPELGFWEALIYPSSDGVRQNIVKRSSLFLYSFENLYIKARGILWAIRNLIKRTDHICLLFIVLILLVPAVFCLIYLLIRIVIFVLLLPLSMLYPHLWKGLVYAGLPIKHIEKKKRDYEEAVEVLKKICKAVNEKLGPRYLIRRDVVEKLYRRPILEAARVDACEVVVQILHGYSGAQAFLNERNHNFFQVAILNRSEKIYNRFSSGIKGNDPVRKMRDFSGNRLMHLAANLASSIVLSRTTGAALKLQLELQWHEEVKKLMRPTELTYKNAEGETSDEVFTREHADLLKEGEQWMKTTAESCSITAALIVTIVFAAAITVPGGSNQETGSPLFKKEIAFTIFEVCDALSLFTAATALLIFLSILTTRFAAKDFLVSLPRRLILGLCALFISTTAMMIAFGAILFLVFYDRSPWMLAPIGLFACLPISVIVTLQLPLVLDLYQSTYIPRFHKHKFQ